MHLRRPSTSLLVSIAVHVIVGAFFAQALLMRRPLLDIFGHAPVAPPVVPAERIGFLRLPKPTPAVVATPGRRGGNGRPVTQTPVVPPIVPPTTVPHVVPKAPVRSPTRPSGEPGTGPLIGGGGELRGVQPRYEDSRLWGGPGAVVTAPKSATERLDSVITSTVHAHNDSMRVAAGSHREPGDWTIEHNGQKYGIDHKYIHLGPLSIPTAVLAMLPLNVTNNPTVSDRERRFNAMHDEIFSQAQRAMNDADFQAAVRSIRERKDRERRERLRAIEQEQAKRKAADSSAASSQ